ncbi:CvpA family protein [Verrucomicrobiaceae bacterium N1E253]|uniref:CvpA family protein n=1 Tax=Oceaniferula marina TaxID=2748318 RepID=A0A851GLM1_9BACT|nr:CvpA family protein [Oceaniferula marina]NWK56731.1 CvpA family protein [Oceaniferula marina]
MNFQELGLTEIIAICILALAVVGFLKGLFRTVSALICLGIAGYAALWGNEHAHDFTASWTHAIPAIWAPKIVALATGLVVFFVCRYLLNFLVDPFDDSQTGRKIGFGLPAAALSLVAGLVLLWLACTGIRYASSLSELRDVQRMLSVDQAAEVEHTSVLLLRAQRAIDDSSLGLWQRKSDPFYHSDKLPLSKLLILYHHEPSRVELLKNRSVSQFLNQPEFIKLAYSPELKHYAQSGKPRDVYNAKATQEALTNESLMQQFQQLDLDKLRSTYAQSSP